MTGQRGLGGIGGTPEDPVVEALREIVARLDALDELAREILRAVDRLSGPPDDTDRF